MPSKPFFDVPSGSRFALRNATVPLCLLDSRSPRYAALAKGTDADGLVHADMLVEDGLIAAIERPGTLAPDLGVDVDSSMILPCMADVHAHLDKGHIWPRSRNPDGSHHGAVVAVGNDRTARWHAEDVMRRMEFALSTAYAKGVSAIRTHLDSLAPQASISFPVFAEVRDRWAGRVDIQATSLAPMDIFLTEEGREVADIVARTGGQLGCNTRFRAIANEPIPPEFDVAMKRMMQLATERGLDLDLHVDEATDPAARTLRRVAELAIEVGFTGDILCGHCCALALQTDEYIEQTLALCREARVDIVSLPIVNMYLQDRVVVEGQRRTPRWRGVTLLHEAKRAGLRVAVAGDNCRDPFHATGDHDMLDTFTQSVRIAHLDHPFGDWICAATSTPADIMGMRRRGRLHVGHDADLIVLRARDYSEMLARFQFDRVVLRRGRPIDTTLPDYRLLDDLMSVG